MPSSMPGGDCVGAALGSRPVGSAVFDSVVTAGRSIGMASTGASTGNRSIGKASIDMTSVVKGADPGGTVESLAEAGPSRASGFGDLDW